MESNLSQPVPNTFAEIEEQRIIAGFVADAPKLDKSALCDAIWDSGLDQLRDLIAEGQKFETAQKVADKKVVESAWEKDFTEARTQIGAHGQSLLRFLNAKYRSAIAEIRGVLKGELPKTHVERLAFIDGLIAGQQALRKLREFEEVGRVAFGTFWRKEKSDWAQFGVILDWVVRQNEAGLSASFRKMFAGIADQAAIAKEVKLLGERLKAAVDRTQRLYGELLLDCAVAFGTQEPDQISLDAQSERLAAWLETIDQ